MTAEECLAMVKVHMLAAESVGNFAKAIALLEFYGALDQEIWSRLTIDEKCERWRARGIPEYAIKEFRDSGLNG